MKKLDVIEQIILLSKELGWVVAMPMSETDQEIQGLVVGDDIFVYQVLKKQKEDEIKLLAIEAPKEVKPEPSSDIH